MTDVASEASGSHPHVRVAGGALRGTREEGVAVFRGIPFAEPPVGPLRFAAPRRARRWDGVRPAVSYGPPPPQGGHFGMDVLARDAAGDDWLTVNVWSPEPGPGAELPVMVWIQGGAYSIGMSGLPEYDGGRLARDGGVVVVTFNYRVGLEGFGQIEGTPANRGLLDQVAALEWVRDNIRAFGGDPGRVTVFGQSAGAGSIAALLAMPRAAGLFRRAVAQSVPATFFSPELAADIAAACAAELGLRPTAAELSGVDPARLSAAADGVGSAMERWVDRWGPVAHRAIPSRRSSTARSCPPPRGRPWRTAPAGASNSSSATPATKRGCSPRSTDCSARSPRSRRRPPCTPTARVDAAHATARPSRPRVPTSCTSWSAPTGCSACRPCTSPRPRAPPAAVPMSTS